MILLPLWGLSLQQNLKILAKTLGKLQNNGYAISKNLSQGFWNQPMSKIIYDVIQRFEVENGVPRLVSTNIQVIQGGEDLLSLAISLLTQMGFYEKFEEKRTSQYIGYRLKNPAKGDKRYQLVLAQRKEGLCISALKEILDPNLLNLINWPYDDQLREIWDSQKGRYWVIPSKKDIFFASMNPEIWYLIKGKIAGNFNFRNAISDSPLGLISNTDSYLTLREDKLFPYAWQVCINSKEVLEEFIIQFAKVLMEQK